MPDPWDGAAPRHDPKQPFPRLDVKQWLDQAYGALKPPTSILEVIRRSAAPILERIRRSAWPWDAQKAADIRARFRPHEPANGMGCMAACYDVLSLLYSPQIALEIRREIFARALTLAEADARRHPEVLNAHIEQIKNDATARGEVLTDAKARREALERMASPHNTVDHLMRLMEERGHAGEPVALQYDRASRSWSPDAEQAIRQVIPDRPGMYFFGVSVSSGNHTVTLAVERAADGSQKMFWLDQHQKGLDGEVTTGNLGTQLERAQGSNSSTTRIWPLQPPTAGAAP